MRGTQQKKKKNELRERERDQQCANYYQATYKHITQNNATLQMIREQRPWQSIQIGSLDVKNQKFNYCIKTGAIDSDTASSSIYKWQDGTSMGS